MSLNHLTALAELAMVWLHDGGTALPGGTVGGEANHGDGRFLIESRK